MDDREEFFADLSELTKAAPKYNVLVIGGDMNGKIGASDAKGSVYNKNTNESGQLLLNYMLECNLKPLNTSLKKREGKLWTHTSPSGAKCHIDYILINNKWKNSALNCEAYSTFCSVGSDHRIVTAKIRLSLRQTKPSGKEKIRYSWNKLLNEDKIKDMYIVEVCNRCQALQDLHADEDANQMYENIKSAHEKPAEISLPVKAKIKQHVPWESENIIEKREMVKNAYEVCLRRNTRSSAAKLEEAKQDLQGFYDREQEKFVNQKIHAVTDAIQHQKSSLAWETG